MHRTAIRTLTVMSLAGLLAAASLPASAKPSRPKQHRGKKAIGEIVSFDAATSMLVVDLPGEADFTGAVDPDVQVKLDHRGWAKKGDSHANPTEGSVEDLLPGTAVLRLKVEDELVTKIRIRPSAEAPPAPLPAEDGDALPGDDLDGDDLAGDDSSDSGDDSADGDDSGDDASADDPTDDDASGEPPAP